MTFSQGLHASGCWSRSRSSTTPRPSRRWSKKRCSPSWTCWRSYRRGQRQVRRAGRRFRRADRRAGQAAGGARQARRLEPGQPPGAGDGRPALPARRDAGQRCSPAASGAAWRSPACCSPSRTSCCSTSRPTTSTPSRWPGWSATCSEYKGTVIAVTHDRYFLDNVAGWILELDRGYGIPWKGNYSSWLEQKQERLRAGGESREQAPADAGARAGMDPHVAQGAPGQGQGARHRLREPAQPGSRAAPRGAGDLHPARPAPGRCRHRVRRASAKPTATAC